MQPFYSLIVSVSDATARTFFFSAAVTVLLAAALVLLSRARKLRLSLKAVRRIAEASELQIPGGIRQPLRNRVPADLRTTPARPQFCVWPAIFERLVAHLTVEDWTRHSLYLYRLGADTELSHEKQALARYAHEVTTEEIEAHYGDGYYALVLTQDRPEQETLFMTHLAIGPYFQSEQLAARLSREFCVNCGRLLPLAPENDPLERLR